MNAFTDYMHNKMHAVESWMSEHKGIVSTIVGAGIGLGLAGLLSSMPETSNSVADIAMNQYVVPGIVGTWNGLLTGGACNMMLGDARLNGPDGWI